MTASISSSGTNLVEVENLVVRYGDAVAVDGISFAVVAGEHLTLLGPSGCGKTTTLRAIAGLEKPHSGVIRINGDVVFSSKDNIDIPTEQRRLAMVFQSYAIWPHMTVAQNVGYGLKVRGDSASEVEKITASHRNRSSVHRSPAPQGRYRPSSPHRHDRTCRCVCR